MLVIEDCPEQRISGDARVAYLVGRAKHLSSFKQEPTGFRRITERRLFRQLPSANRADPKTALRVVLRLASHQRQ
jgi:Holliday junction resolvasome RuvABC DNA-binding subunit